MQIIKDKQIIDNAWTFVDDETEVNDTGNITVSLQRWISAQQQLLNRTGKVGVRFRPTDNSDLIADALQGLELIELDFPGFGDGRLFSHAQLLRSRYGYQGEIRAVGNYLPDQVYYLSRVGVNAFQLADPNQAPLVISGLNDFSVNYQVSIA